ncbi:MAG: citrate/2-methylcitrate synthase [Gemmatimonadales bacterium]|nr:citrate/2-methylcitrate synthase [Gemmatimonadales bacterium]
MTQSIQSSVCHLDAERGRLTYRGYDVVELAERSTFEETAFLLVSGGLPTSRELRAYRRAIVANGRLSPVARRLLKAAPADADELTVLRTVVSGLDLAPAAAEAGPDVIGAPALRVLGAVPAIVLQRARGDRAVRFRGEVAAALASAWNDAPPEAVVRALDAALILRADNELNPGTFAVRVAASTQADLVSCVVAGLGALAGAKHSGHSAAVLRLLREVGEPSRAREVVRGLVAAGSKPSGFGHPVYRGEDPRTPVARRLAEAACVAAGAGQWFALARAVEEAVAAESDARANVDFYLTVIYLAAKVPPTAFAALFAVARVPGWIAHALEQGRDPELIRPRATYVGPLQQAWKPTRARR